MRYLLDTHTLIWFISGDNQLSTRCRKLIEDSNNEIYLSIASLWEMAIKHSIGKLNLSQPFNKLFPLQLIENDILLLGITLDHLYDVCDLPLHHRDPFDRIMVSQARIEDLQLISADSMLDGYDIQRVW